MGLLLIILTGLSWGGVGIILDRAARRGMDACAFQMAGNILGAGGAWLVLVRWPVLLAGSAVPRLMPLVWIMGVAGVLGTAGMFAMQRALSRGFSAGVWTVGQSAMVVPFIFGMVFLAQPFHWTGVLGVVATIVCLGLLAAVHGGMEEGGAGGRKGTGWFGLALLAFAFLGAQQTLCMVPSSWPGWTDAAQLRVPIVAMAGGGVMAVVAGFRRRWPTRGEWFLAAGYGAVGLLGQVLLFAAMDRLRAEGRLAVAYPIAVGLCILVMAVRDAAANRSGRTPLALAGILFGLTGVVLIACG